MAVLCLCRCMGFLHCPERVILSRVGLGLLIVATSLVAVCGLYALTPASVAAAQAQ